MKTPLMFIAFMSALLVSCAQKKNLDVQPAGSFPNTTGDTFTYAVIDSLNNTNFNLQVSVLGSQKLPNGKVANMWIFNYPNMIDTNYVVSNVDSAVFYDKDRIDIARVYHFPLAVGNKWRQSFLTDSVYVNSNGPINTPAGEFANAFLINEKGHSYNYIIKRDQWVVPNIGMVKQNLYELNLGAVTYQTWTLTSYHLNSSNN
jgi:hypothetical protein